MLLCCSLILRQFHVIQKLTLWKKLDISWNLFHYSKSDCSKDYTVTDRPIGDSNLKLQLRCFVSRCYWLSACPKLDLSNLHRRSVDLTPHPLSFRNTAEQSAHRKSIKTCWMRFFNWPVSLFVSAEQPLPLIRFQRCSGRGDSKGLGTNSEAGKSSSLHRPLQFW